MTDKTDKDSSTKHDADGFRGNLSADKNKQAQTIDGKVPQVGGLTDDGKHANMPGTDYTKVQKSEHVEAIQDKIAKDGLLGGKPSTGSFDTKTKADAEAEDAEHDKDGSDDSDDETEVHGVGTVREGSTASNPSRSGTSDTKGDTQGTASGQAGKTTTAANVSKPSYQGGKANDASGYGKDKK